MSEWPSNSFKHFLLVILPCMNDMILVSIHKELQVVYSCHQVFCCPESVNTKQENPVRTLCSAFVQGIVRVGYSLSFPLL